MYLGHFGIIGLVLATAIQINYEPYSVQFKIMNNGELSVDQYMG